MEHRQPLTIDEVQGATRPLLGGRASARLLEAKHRNQVFAIGEQAIFKAYLCDGAATRQARKVATLRFLEGRGLPVPRLLGHGVLPKGPSGVPWTLETRVVAGHVRPTRAELDTPQGWEFHRALGRWLPMLHAFDGFPCFGTWDANGPATLAAQVLPRAGTVRAQTAGLHGVPQALLRRAGQELDRLEPAIRAADRLRPRLLHGDYGSSNVAVGRTADGRVGVVAVFDFESAAPGDPVEDLLWTADHGLESRIFRSFVAGYLEQGRLDPDAPERFAFYQLEHCLDVLGWARDADPEWFAQAQWLIEQVLDGVRLRLA
jgi:aminoglycoside phosphotransferase (APT) family kinase protein